VSAWTDYASEFLPALRYLHAAGGLPAWLMLAMAAHESGVPPQAGSTLLVETNPWGVVCHTSEYPCHDAGNGYSFQVYPSIRAAAQDLIVALGPQRLQYAGDPVRFMDNLQATGWDYPPDGYADSVLYTWGPPAQAALQALGVDPVTAGGGGIGSVIQDLGFPSIAPAVVGTAAGALALSATIVATLQATGHLRHRREHHLWPWHLSRR
jgi:hypothetical protein